MISTGKGQVFEDNVDASTRFFRCDFEDCVFRRCDVASSVFMECNMKNVRFEDCNIAHSLFVGCNLLGAKFGYDVKVDDIHRKIYDKVEEFGLEMEMWSSANGKKFCHGGWAIHLAGEEGRVLAAEVGRRLAATIIFLNSDPSMDSEVNYYTSNTIARKEIKRLKEAEGV